MSQNPFETPQAADPYGAPPLASGKFDIGVSVSEAWQLTTSTAGLQIGVLVVWLIAFTVAALTVIGLFVVCPVLAFGYIRFLLNSHDGGAEFGDAFSGFSEYGRALGSFFLFGLVIVLLGVPSQVLSQIGAMEQMPSLMILSFVVSMAIGLGVTVRIYFAPFYIVDQGLGAFDAIKASWAATSDQKLMVIVLSLVAGIIGALGMIACGVGALFTLPLSYLIWVSAYRQMVPSPGGA